MPRSEPPYDPRFTANASTRSPHVETGSSLLAVRKSPSWLRDRSGTYPTGVRKPEADISNNRRSTRSLVPVSAVRSAHQIRRPMPAASARRDTPVRPNRLHDGHHPRHAARSTDWSLRPTLLLARICNRLAVFARAAEASAPGVRSTEAAASIFAPGPATREQ